jgi:PAS domain S-box-containing protein
MTNGGDRRDPIFQSIALSAPASMMLLDRDARIRFINRTAPGLTPEDVIGTLPYQYVPADQHEEMRRCFNQVVETREVGTYRNMFVLPDETASYWESRVSPVVEDDQVTGFVVFSLDITSERLLAQEQARFFELTPVIFVVSDVEGRFTRVSSSFEEVLGYGADEALGRSFQDFMHPDDRARSLEVFQDLLPGGHARDFEARVRHRDGHYVTVQWSGTADQAHRLVYGVGRDVTHQRAVEDKLRQTQKIEAVGQLAGGVAHDFNNLLQAISLNTQAALSMVSDRPGVASYLQEIQLASDRASDLTRQLLTFSRQATITRTALAPNGVVREVLKMIRRLIPSSIEIDFVPGHELGSISGDVAQLEQVFVNVILNARDAMPDGGKIMVETENTLVDGRYCEAHPWAHPGRYVLVTVTDTGEGMPADVKDRIFEPFYTTKEPGKGTGLGLSTLYGIIQQHDGFVHVYSEPGVGTSFKIYLPVVERPADTIGNKLDDESANGGVAVSSDPEARRTILIAEDEVLVRTALVKALERAGYDVIAVADGLEALNCARTCASRFDLVLLDMVMPNLGGAETYIRIRAQGETMPVLFCSGYSDSSEFKDKLPPGTEILRKPFKIDELLRRIRLALEET